MITHLGFAEGSNEATVRKHNYDAFSRPVRIELLISIADSIYEREEKMEKSTQNINYKFSDKTNVSVEFDVFGENFDVNKFSEIMNIEPSGIRGKKKKSPTNIEKPYITWFISTGYEDSSDVSEQVNKILETLVEKKEILIKLKDEEDLEYKFEIVINIIEGYSPGLVIEKDFIDFMSSIGAGVDVDIYAYPYKEVFIFDD